MYDIVMDGARADAAAARATGICKAPAVFKSQQDGYRRWADRATALGRSADWRAWSEDEACVQRAVAVDGEAEPDATAYCSLDLGTR